MIHDANSSAQLLPLAYCPQGRDYAVIFAQLPGFVWLDSGAERAYGGRYDILSALPCSTLTLLKSGEIKLDGLAVELDVDAWINNQLNALAHVCSPTLPFCGGILGYVGYAYRHQDHGIHPKDSDVIPLLQLGVYPWALIQDHLEQTAWLYFSPLCPAELTQQVTRQLNSWPDNDLPEQRMAKLQQHFSCGPFAAHTTKSAYLEKVTRILAYIRAGDAYQVNLSQQFSAEFSGSSFAAYCALREVASSPFGAYLKTDTGAILCHSPEQFIGIAGKLATTRPIKGTAARSHDDATRDQALAQELVHSAKNRAENLMIVDLLRNDFSQNCELFSVKTEELFALKTYANVHHLVSWVEGRLKANVTPWQFFTACFPGGSITGAPKKRAMEIIDELEDRGRNIYCGTIGYWSANGNMDTNIAIRTLLVDHNLIHVWGGGGIVADSTAEAEYAETLQKIALLQQTLTRRSSNQSGTP